MERLEVEDDEQRQRRIQNRLEKLNNLSSAKLSTPPLTFDFGDRTTCPVSPPTELLARVQAFLPQIGASNALLEQRVRADPDSVNIEHIGGKMGQYIEMNLGLGVFENRVHHKMSSQKQDVDASTSSSSETSSSVDDNDDSCSSDTDTDSSSEIITSFSRAPRLIRPLPRRSPTSRLNSIQVLGEKANENKLGITSDSLRQS